MRVGKVSQTRQFVAVKSVKLPSGAEHASSSENETSWNKETSCVNNYSRNGLVSNANRFYYVGGRNALADNVKNMDDDENANARKRKAADKTLTENADRDELRKAVGERSSSGIAKPKRLTPRQKRICELLMSKHGKDVEKTPEYVWKAPYEPGSAWADQVDSDMFKRGGGEKKSAASPSKAASRGSSAGESSEGRYFEECQVIIETRTNLQHSGVPEDAAAK